MFPFVEASGISPLDNLSPKNSEKDSYVGSSNRPQIFIAVAKITIYLVYEFIPFTRKTK